MSDKMSKKEMDDLLAYLRQNRENNIFYTAPVGYFWRLGIKRKNNMLNTLIKILEKRGYLSNKEVRELLVIK